MKTLLAEESSVQLSTLPGRKPWLLEHFHDLICELPLLSRKRGRIGVPVQTSANVCVDPRARVWELVRESVQVAHLLEERLELGVVDRHRERARTRSIAEETDPRRPPQRSLAAAGWPPFLALLHDGGDRQVHEVPTRDVQPDYATQENSDQWAVSSPSARRQLVRLSGLPRHRFGSSTHLIPSPMGSSGVGIAANPDRARPEPRPQEPSPEGHHETTEYPRLRPNKRAPDCSSPTASRTGSRPALPARATHARARARRGAPRAHRGAP